MTEPSFARPFQKFLNSDWGPDLPSTAGLIRGLQLGTQVREKDKQKDIANYILTHVGPSSKLTKGLNELQTSADEKEGEYVAEGSQSEEPSFLNQSLNWLSKPGSAVTSSIENVFEDVTEEPTTNPLEYLSRVLSPDISNFKPVAAAVPQLVTELPDDPILEMIPGVNDFSPIRDIANKVGSEVLQATTGNENADFQKFLRKENPYRSGQQVLEKHTDLPKGATLGLGFGWDVLADPLNLLPGAGLVNKARKLLRPGLQTREAAETAVRELNAPVEAKLSRMAANEGVDPGPAAFGFDRPSQPQLNLGRPTAEAGIVGAPSLSRTPIMPRVEPAPAAKLQRISDQTHAREGGVPLEPEQIYPRSIKPLSERAAFPGRMREARMRIQGQLYDPARNLISRGTAQDIVDRIARGDVPNAPPMLPKVSGDEAYRAGFRADSFINRPGKTLPPPGQIHLATKLWDDTEALARKAGKKSMNHPANVKWRINKTIAMLNAAEQAIVQSGKTPTYWNDMGVRLSDVLNRVRPTNSKEFNEVLEAFSHQTPDKIANPELRRIISGEIARRSYNSADLVSNLSQYARQARRNVEDILVSPMEREARLGAVAKGMSGAMTRNGMSPGESKVALEGILGDVGLDQNWGRYGSKPKILGPHADDVSTEAIDRNNRQVFGLLGVSPNITPKNGILPRVADSILTRSSTWYGKMGHEKDLARKIHGYEFDAVMRRKTLNGIHKNYTIEEQTDAWDIFTGRIPATNPKAAALAMKFQEYFDAAWSSDIGIAKSVNDIMSSGDNVAVRMGSTMSQLNRELELMGKNITEGFQFTDSAKYQDDILDEVWDFSENGETFLASIKTHRPKNPAKFLATLDTAQVRASAKLSALDDFRARFGAVVPSAKEGITANKNLHDRLAGRYYHPEVLKAFKRTMEEADRGFYRPDSPIMRTIAAVTRAFKTQVTIYLPAHHLRNAWGSAYNMYLDGINDPWVFRKALKITAHRNPVKQAIKDGDPQAITDFLRNPQKLADETPWGNRIVIDKKGQTMTVGEVYQAMSSRGMLPPARDLEDYDFYGDGEDFLTKFRPFGGRYYRAASGTSEFVDHTMRAAHFIGIIEQSIRRGAKINKKLLDDASARVRKFQPDGRDLTREEQQLRIFIPFYSWTRKAVPLMVAATIDRPARLMTYPKLQMNLQQALGLDPGPEGYLDPYPDDQLFPEWYRAGGLGPVGLAQAPGLLGTLGNLGRTDKDEAGNPIGYTTIDPGEQAFGFNQFASTFGNDPARGVGGMLNPIFRVPFEVMSGHTLQTNQEIAEMEGEYWATTVPFASPFVRIFNWAPGGSTKQAEYEGNVDQQDIINILTGLNVQGSGPYITGAELEARERLSGD